MTPEEQTRYAEMERHCIVMDANYERLIRTTVRLKVFAVCAILLGALGLIFNAIRAVYGVCP